MKHKILKPEKDFELKLQIEKSEYKLPHSDEEINKSNIYWMFSAYYSPFMPMIDLSFAFIELKKMLNNG